jgi:hypothetical protein
MSNELLSTLPPLPDGVWIASKDPTTLTRLWGKLSQYDQLFSDESRGDLQGYVAHMSSPTAVIFETYQGVLVLDCLKVGRSAEAHLSFWDKKLSVRKPLVSQMLGWAFDVYNLHRIAVMLPVYAKAVKFFVRDKLGFRKEGVMRDAMLSRGKWIDVEIYALLKEEFDVRT